MQDLIHRIKQLHKECDQLPFSLYASVKEQHILNVPIHKPLLIMVLSGRKQIGKEFDIEAGKTSSKNSPPPTRHPPPPSIAHSASVCHAYTPCEQLKAMTVLHDDGVAF